MSPSANEPIVIEATVIDDDSSGTARCSGDGDTADKKARGAKQLLAGGAIAAIGVPMLVLPGPGLAAIAGGIALAGRGYQNLTGNDVISEEMREDPEFVEGQQAGERFAQRMRDFAAEDLAPAGARLASDLKETGGAVAHGIKDAGKTAADIAGKGLRAAVGGDAADRAEDFAQRNVAPVVDAAASFGRGLVSGLSPHVAKAAHSGAQVAADAVQKLADKTRDLMR